MGFRLQRCLQKNLDRAFIPEYPRNMLKNLWISGIAVFITMPFFVSAADVSIHEIAWMGTSASTADEWIEFYSETGKSLEGWTLSTEDGGMTINLSGAIPAGGYFLIERTDDTTVPNISADLIAPFGSGLNNSGEILVLKNSSGDTEERVDASSKWPAGDNTTKETMQWNGFAWITAAGTPRAPNAGESSTSSGTEAATSGSTNTSTSSSSGTSEVFGQAIYNPLIAYAGADRSAAVGTYVEFDGYATVASSEPVTNARFWWNFGDGETKEGKNVSHMYHVPGIYTVGLHVSSGEYVASDYALVTVLPNQVRISSVLTGDGGFVALLNPSAISVDIGSWIIEDGKHNTFVVPVKTIIGSGAKISFLNSVTKLFFDVGAGSSAVLYFPNYALSSRWTPAISSEAQEANTNGEPQLILKNIAEGAPQPIPENTSEEAESSERTGAQKSGGESEENKAASTLFGFTPSLGIFFGIALIVSLGGAIGVFFFRGRILP